MEKENEEHPELKIKLVIILITFTSYLLTVENNAEKFILAEV